MFQISLQDVELPFVTAPLENLLAHAQNRLLSELVDGSHWEGALSSSSLSTATAVIALCTVDSQANRVLVQNGIDWLCRHQNADGGWGDTVLSFSNSSTTLLCRAALQMAGQPAPATRNADRWIQQYCGGPDTEKVTRAVIERYGNDRTFSVPILMACAIAGLFGENRRDNWRQVLPLPFELAAFPRRWYGFLQLPVVSYALPALIAIGYARFVHAPPAWPIRQLRRALWPRVSALLNEIQPPNGGFLEATPLTSFVAMALASAGQAQHPVVTRGISFLKTSVRPDGSWPIDTNLATWATTHAVKAMGNRLPSNIAFNIRQWLFNQQYRVRHPYTDAPPGGWAWTDLPGGVPDGDDTPGALLALHQLKTNASQPATLEAAEVGVNWLLNLQNRDGGIPTFCRGWGALPFDRSSPDLTAHTVRAWTIWEPELSAPLRARVQRQTRAAFRYLIKTQRAEGTWHPLWFGNQHHPEEANPTYGTTQVLLALQKWSEAPSDCISRATDWLINQQNADGGWGAGGSTPSTIEETALTLEALAGEPSVPQQLLDRGIAWLATATQQGTQFPPAPIGFYFAKLWYYEKLYPLIWTIAALERIKARRNHPVSATGSASS